MVPFYLSSRFFPLPRPERKEKTKRGRGRGAACFCTHYLGLPWGEGGGKEKEGGNRRSFQVAWVCNVGRKGKGKKKGKRERSRHLNLGLKGEKGEGGGGGEGRGISSLKPFFDAEATFCQGERGRVGVSFMLVARREGGGKEGEKKPSVCSFFPVVICPPMRNEKKEGEGGRSYHSRFLPQQLAYRKRKGRKKGKTTT